MKDLAMHRGDTGGQAELSVGQQQGLIKDDSLRSTAISLQFLHPSGPAARLGSEAQQASRLASLACICKGKLPESAQVLWP